MSGDDVNGVPEPPEQPDFPERRPVRASCAECEHEWTLMFTPMPLENAARIMRSAHCPMCAADASHIYVGGKP